MAWFRKTKTPKPVRQERPRSNVPEGLWVKCEGCKEVIYSRDLDPLLFGTPEALALKSTGGIANAQLAYRLFEQEFATDRAKALLAAGANPQRPLWASTGVKDPSLPDTLYVTELAVAGVVNTMPEKTLEATFDHAPLHGDAVTGSYADAQKVLDDLAAVGVDYDDVTALLEKEGVEKFIASWNELLDTVTAALEAARPGATQ